MKIIGAGLSGLLAGCMFPGSTIFEQQHQLPNNHGAVLRFRSDEISKALGIPFKRVRVHKDVWYEGESVYPAIFLQNMYSRKVTGKYISRSMGNTKDCWRYIAPHDFIQQLAERCNIQYGCVYGLTEIAQKKSTISTIPMPVLMNIVGLNYPNLSFDRQQIWSTICEFKDADLYQTIYFPGDDIGVYRASFTGNRLIIESIDDPMLWGFNIDSILKAFGIESTPIVKEVKSQEYGKIVEIDHDVRRKIMADLTHDFNIYSLGRYATWRNILLDDVFKDIQRIRDLVKMDSYSRKLKIAGEL